MGKPIRKIAGSPASDGVNSCPTVMAPSDDPALIAGPVLSVSDDEVVLQGDDLSAGDRLALNIPAGENVIRMPKALYLEGARRIAEGA